MIAQEKSANAYDGKTEEDGRGENGGDRWPQLDRRRGPTN